MNIENLSTLKINKLTQAQYDRELAAGNIDPNALYLTPEEEIDFPVDSVNGKTGVVTLSASDVGAAPLSHTHAVSEITGTLGVPKGGTGKTSLTSGQVLVGNGTGAVTQKAIDTSATNGSANLITSGAVYTGLAGKLNTSGGTLTGGLTLPNITIKDDNYAELSKVVDTNGSIRGLFRITDQNTFGIQQRETGASFMESYEFPSLETGLTAHKYYTVLTTKKAEAATALTASRALGFATMYNPYADEFQIPENANLDSYTTGGVYRSASAAITKTLTNVPDSLNTAFRLEVKNIATNNGVLQTIIANSTNIRIYCRVSDGATGVFGVWKRLSFETVASGGTATD